MTEKVVRNRLVDVAKGLSILLVVLGHSHILDTDVNRAFSSFRIPFFFFLSGIFFRYTGTLRSIFFSKSDSLLKPYFITLLIVACFNNFADGMFWHRLIEILYGVGDTIKWPWSPLWFLPHLWLLFMSSYFLIRSNLYKKDSKYHNVPLFVFLLFAGNLITRTSPNQDYFTFGSYVEAYGLPFSAEILPISLIFFLLGHTYRKKVKSFTPSFLIFPLCFAIFVISHLYFDIYVDLNHRVYRNVLTALLVANCGIYFSLSISYFINRINPIANIMAYIGSRSLFVLLFHGFFMTWFNMKIGNQFWFTPILSYCLSIVSCLFLSMIAYSNDYLSLIFISVPKNPLFQKIVSARSSSSARSTD